MLRVEPLDPRAWRLWRALRLRALADAPDAFADTLAAALARDDAHWIERTATVSEWTRVVLLASDDDQPIGTAVGLIAPAEPDVAHLYAMWVAPTARRRGVGRALADAVVAWARGQGAARVVLGVTETNAGARRLYGRLGFVESAAREPLRPGSSLHTVTMTRRL